MRIKFRYAIGKSELKMSRRAFRAGEIALGRPADVEKRTAPEKGSVKHK